MVEEVRELVEYAGNRDGANEAALLRVFEDRQEQTKRRGAILNQQIEEVLKQ